MNQQPPQRAPYSLHLRERIVWQFVVLGLYAFAIAESYGQRPCTRSVYNMLDDYYAYSYPIALTGRDGQGTVNVLVSYVIQPMFRHPTEEALAIISLDPLHTLRGDQIENVRVLLGK